MAKRKRPPPDKLIVPQEAATWTVPPNQAGMRLDRFLQVKLRHSSRNRIQQLIAERNVTANGKPVGRSYRVKLDEEISLPLPPPPDAAFRIDEIELNIIYEDDLLIVLNKQPNIVVHPSGSHLYDTLINALHLRYRDLEDAEKDIIPKLAHRIDKETSGVLVAVKTGRHERGSPLVFENTGVVKEYFAIAEGKINEESFEINQPRRAEPELEDAEQPKPARRASVKRKLAAVAVLLVMVAIGLAAAVTYNVARGPMELVVTPDGREGYARISDAVAAAGRGARIIVKPGEYTDHVVLGKPVTIEGNGKVPPVLRAVRDCAILSRANGAVVKNLNIALDAEIGKSAVFVESGNLRLENCNVTSQGLACVEVAGGQPTVIDCVIGHSRSSGLFVRGESRGLFEKNEIRDCARSGIVVSDKANPTCRDNTVQRCKQGGIKAYNNGRGLFERNDISECDLAAVVTRAGGAPTVTACKLHDNKADGILVLEQGKGAFEHNEIWGNLGSGVVIHADGAATIRNNKIKGNAGHGILAEPGARSVIQDNQSEGNGRSDQIEAD